MKTMSLSLASLGFVLALSAEAGAADICTNLMNAYDHAAKVGGISSNEILGDNNVYRAILAEMKVSNSIALRQLNLTLMMQNKCKLPSAPEYINDYVSDTLKCSEDRLKGKYDAPSCDLATWVRTSPKD